MENPVKYVNKVISYKITFVKNLIFCLIIIIFLNIIIFWIKIVLRINYFVLKKVILLMKIVKNVKRFVNVIMIQII